MSDRHFTLEELSAYLDGELDLDDAQRAHLKDCPECTKVFEGQRSLRKLARDAAPTIPTEQMWSAIKEQIGAEIKKQIAETGGRKRDPAGKKSQKPSRAADPKAGGFRWGPGLWLGLSSALAAAGVLLIIRPAVEEPRPMPELLRAAKPTPPPAPGKPRTPDPGPAPAHEARPTRDASADWASAREDSEPAQPRRKASKSRESKSDAAPASRAAATKARKPASEPAHITVASVPTGYTYTLTGMVGNTTSASPSTSGMALAFSNASVVTERSEIRIQTGAAGGAYSHSSPAPSANFRIMSADAPSAATETRSIRPGLVSLGDSSSTTAAKPRPMHIAKRFILSADRIVKDDPGLISASGSVLVYPVQPDGSYSVTVDGVTRTMTGKLEGELAEIVNPGERLILHTKAGAHSTPPKPANQKPAR